MFLLAHTVAAQLFPFLLNVPAAEQESVQQPEGRVTPPNTYKSFLDGAQPASVPSAGRKQGGALACGQSRGRPF